MPAAPRKMIILSVLAWTVRFVVVTTLDPVGVTITISVAAVPETNVATLVAVVENVAVPLIEADPVQIPVKVGDAVGAFSPKDVPSPTVSEAVEERTPPAELRTVPAPNLPACAQ